MKRLLFDYSLDFGSIDFRQHPELYRIGKGEQGVLLIEPYKSEILPHWRFKTVAEAKKSSAYIYKMFLGYLKADDFPVLTWLASSYKWDGRVRDDTRTTKRAANMTRRRARYSRAAKMARRQKQRRSSTRNMLLLVSMQSTAGSKKSTCPIMKKLKFQRCSIRFTGE